jgi:ribosomal protein S18 acetylase RimI-like enzyme
MGPKIMIRPMQGEAEARVCTEAMVNSEPWLTLRYSYDITYKVITDSAREPYVAVVGSEIAGFIVLNLVGPLRGYIQAICVLPASRGKGIGTRLLTFAEERIFREFPNVFLFVSSFNEAAQKFYASLGYQRIGEVPDYVVKGHSEYLMRKTIGPMAEFAPNC